MKKCFILLFFALPIISYGQSQLKDSIENLKIEPAINSLKGIGTAKDTATAITLLKEYAIGGNSIAMLRLGILYRIQNKVPDAIHYFQKAAEKGNTDGWYQLAVLHKDFKDARQDLNKTYYYFNKGAEANNLMCMYGKAYMLFKGFGCNQNYAEAVKLFYYCANRGQVNSMYFYGLCLRNGYGIARDETQAIVWLKKARSYGYIDAFREIGSRNPENSNQDAKNLAQQITHSSSLVKPLNQYQKVQHNLPNKFLGGQYNGYLFRYDWSGQNVLSSSRLEVTLKSSNNLLTGSWKENDSLIVQLSAFITPFEIQFSNTRIHKKDHYSSVKAINYVFKTAQLQCNIKNDSVFIEGSIEMFSEAKNEPDKPVYIFLRRPLTDLERKVRPQINSSLVNTSQHLDDNLDGELNFKLFPNPCNDILNIHFHLDNVSSVKTELQNSKGQLIISKEGGKLSAGYYNLTLNTQSIPSGPYTVIFHLGDKSIRRQIIKL